MSLLPAPQPSWARSRRCARLPAAADSLSSPPTTGQPSKARGRPKAAPARLTWRSAGTAGSGCPQGNFLYQVLAARRAGETTITGEEIRAIRKKLGLNQQQFGQLLNTSFVTVSQWERGTPPSPYHLGLLQRFQRGIQRREEEQQSVDDIAALLITDGVIAALCLLLAWAADET